MAQRYKLEIFGDLEKALLRYIELSKSYLDVRLEKSVYLDSIVRYFISYR